MNGWEFMVDASDTKPWDSIAFKRRQEDTAKRVTDGLAEAWFQGFELEDAFEVICFLEGYFIGFLKI